MLLKTLITGALQVNTYLLVCEETKQGAVIDPGGDEEKIGRFFERQEIALKYVINTHAHPDHIVGNTYLKQQMKALIAIHKDDADVLEDPHPLMLSFMPGNYIPTPADIKLEDGDKLQIGKIELKVIHTPGHTPGGICLLTEGTIFSGDTLFAGGIGRTDFPGGSYKAIINSIQKRLFSLDPDLRVLPGHGPFSTIKEEMESNPFLT